MCAWEREAGWREGRGVRHLDRLMTGERARTHARISGLASVHPCQGVACVGTGKRPNRQTDLGDGDGGADVEALAQVRAKRLLCGVCVCGGGRVGGGEVKRSPPLFGATDGARTVVTWPKGSMATILWCAHLCAERRVVDDAEAQARE